MKRFTSLPIAALVCLIAFLIADFFGCETGLKDPKPAVSVQTQQAVEMLPRQVQFVSMIDFQEMKRDIEDVFFDQDIVPFEQLEREITDRLQDFVDATGFDPQQDFHKAYGALDINVPDATPYVVLYLDYDRDRLQSFIEENLDEEFTFEEYRGVPVYQPATKESGNTGYVALVNDEMIVASTRMKEVKAMIDRLNSDGETLSDDAQFMELMERVAGGNAWAVMRGIDKIQQKGSNAGSAPQAIEQMSRVVQDVAVSVEVSEDDVVGRAWLTPVPDVSTKDLASLTKGAIAAVKTLLDLESEEVEILDDIRVRRKGDMVRVDFEVELPEFEEWGHGHEHRRHMHN